jgi:alkylation response protein AidB-like acyl-CoA dehydrogenase
MDGDELDLFRKALQQVTAANTGRALDGALDELGWSDALAKAVAGRSARTAARHCQQVLAGIGFTTEHDLHHHVRRALVLDRLFGDTRSLTRQLGEELLGRGGLPAILPL